MKGLWAQETVRIEQSTVRNHVYCVFGVFFLCGFSTSIRPTSSVFTISHLFTEVTSNFRMQGRHPVCGTNPHVFLLQMEKFVFAATRHVLVIVGGVLMVVRAACMMRRMTLNTGHE